MFDVRIKYLASVFWDADSLIPNPKDISNILKELSDDGFIPFNFAEASVSGLKNRMAFQTENSEFQITLSGKRVDINKLATDSTGSNVGDLKEFCTKSSRFLKFFLEYFKREGQRLALIQQGLLKEMDDSQYTDIHKKLFNVPEIYSSNIPFEWDWRNVSKISREFNSITEIINTIVKISKCKVHVKSAKIQEPIEYNRIHVLIDCNTSHENSETRFGTDHVMEFFKDSCDWQNELYKNISDLIIED